MLTIERHGDFEIGDVSKESLGNAASQWKRSGPREFCAFV